MTDRRDRLRELLDAVLDEGNADRGDPIVWWCAAHGHRNPDTSTAEKPGPEGA